MCARHIQSFNEKFTHFESMVGGLWGVGRRGRAFEFVFIEKKVHFSKLHLTVSCCHLPTRILPLKLSPATRNSLNMRLSEGKTIFSKKMKETEAYSKL